VPELGGGNTAKRTIGDRMPRWTAEARAKQGETINRWAPWSSSTGPRTSAGKAASSRNAYRGARREAVRSLLRAARAMVRELVHLEVRGVKISGSNASLGVLSHRANELAEELLTVADRLVAAGQLAPALKLRCWLARKYIP
jgi:hypothetical protein